MSLIPAQLTLGQFIDLLTEIHAHHPYVYIGFDLNTPVGDACSYRGNYNDLALLPNSRSNPYVHENICCLLMFCRGCIGMTFQGYKGGDYIMSRDTPLYYTHDWSEYSNLIITGIARQRINDDEFWFQIMYCKGSHCKCA